MRFCQRLLTKIFNFFRKKISFYENLALIMPESRIETDRIAVSGVRFSTDAFRGGGAVLLQTGVLYGWVRIVTEMVCLKSSRCLNFFEIFIKFFIGDDHSP